jgi:hypothetical protein
MIVGILLVTFLTFISVGAAFFAAFGLIGILYAWFLANIVFIVVGAISALKN